MTEQGQIIIQTPDGTLIALPPDDASAFIDQVRAGASPEELTAWVEATLAATRPPYHEAADLAELMAAGRRGVLIALRRDDETGRLHRT